MALPPLPHPADPRAAPAGPIHGAVIYGTPDPVPAPPADDVEPGPPGPPSSLLPPAPADAE